MAFAKAGYGDELVNAYQRRTSDKDFRRNFLPDWRERIRSEMRTKSSGILDRRCPKAAEEIDDSFPDLDVLKAYVEPATSGTHPEYAKPFDWFLAPNLPDLLSIMTIYFELTHNGIHRTCRNLLWPGLLLVAFRQVALAKDATASGKLPVKILPDILGIIQKAPGLTSDVPAFCTKIDMNRAHPKTGSIPEFRLHVDPTHLNTVVEGAFEHPDPNIGKLELRRAEEKLRARSEQLRQGVEPADDEEKAGREYKVVDPLEPIKVYFPAAILRIAAPSLITEYEDLKEQKEVAKRAAEERKAARARGETLPRKSPVKAKPKAKATPSVGATSSSSSSSQAAPPSSSQVADLPRRKPFTKVKSALDMCLEAAADREATAAVQSKRRAPVPVDLCSSPIQVVESSQPKRASVSPTGDSDSGTVPVAKSPRKHRRQHSPREAVVIDLDSDSADEPMIKPLAKPAATRPVASKSIATSFASSKASVTKAKKPVKASITYIDLSD